MPPNDWKFRTFEGEYTGDWDVYIASWDRAIKIVEKYLNVRVFGYDPGMLCSDRETDRNSCDIPKWLIINIIKQADAANTLHNEAMLNNATAYFALQDTKDALCADIERLRSMIPPTVREGWVPESKLYEAQDRIKELELVLKPFAEHRENSNSWANAKRLLKGEG